MNEKQKDTYIAWLNDAHAMEMGLVTMLEKQVEETEGDPKMQSRIKEHLEETKRHAELIESCVERHGSNVSAGKDILSKMSSALSGTSMSMMSDAIVKNVHSSYAAEHFEIATYNTLRAAAEALGDNETAEICDQILVDEEMMAGWLIEQLPIVVENHLAKVMTD